VPEEFLFTEFIGPETKVKLVITQTSGNSYEVKDPISECCGLITREADGTFTIQNFGFYNTRGFASLEYAILAWEIDFVYHLGEE